MSKKSPCTARKKPCRRCFAIFFFLENHKDIRHKREICTLEASRFNNGSCHSQCSLKCVHLSSWQQLVKLQPGLL